MRRLRTIAPRRKLDISTVFYTRVIYKERWLARSCMQQMSRTVQRQKLLQRTNLGLRVGGSTRQTPITEDRTIWKALLFIIIATAHKLIVSDNGFGT